MDDGDAARARRAVVAVLSLYSEETAFSDDRARLIELLAPRVAAAIAALDVRRAEPRVATFERSGSRAARLAALRAIP